MHSRRAGGRPRLRPAILWSVTDRATVIVSNRGPVTYGFDTAGLPVPAKTGGGLASAMAPLLDTGAIWVCAAMGPADRAAIERGSVPDNVAMVDVDQDTYDRAYNRVANETLWFAHHGMLPDDHAARLDASGTWSNDWAAFRSFNRSLAGRVIETAPDGAAVLVQDYHLCLLAPMIVSQRPDLRLVHFSHTPFAGPDDLKLPQRERHELIGAMARHHACGFHSRRWADAFEATVIDAGAAPPRTFVSPLAPDTEGIRNVARSEQCRAELADLERDLGDHKLITRVDRIEPTKNIIAGFEAFDVLLTRHPEHAGRVVFAAFTYPSREALDAYRSLGDQIRNTVEALNERHGTHDWQPVRLDLTDNLPGAVAALRRYDVLLVNPLRDGLNLIAMEGPVVNEHHGRLVLSTEAGAHDQLRAHAFAIDPGDIEATAEALHEALTTDASSAAAAAEGQRRIIATRSPTSWLADQLGHAG